MPKAFTESEKQWIGEQLLEGGARLFSQYGLKKTSIEELASTAGISKAAFYIFYESKEALFMEVVEQAEIRFRREVLEAVDLPGHSPQARLVAVLEKAFSLWKTIPVLQFFTRDDYEQLTRKISLGKIQEHMLSDREFVEDLIARCLASGIPVRAQADEISGLLYVILLAILHEDDFGPGKLSASIHLLLELTAAYCLGEIDLPEGNFK